MRFTRPFLTLIASSLLSMNAHGGVLFQRGSGASETAGLTNISTGTAANQFTINPFETLGSARIFVDDVDSAAAGGTRTNGVIDGFSGTLGWAIYSDNAGNVGTQIAYGSDATVDVADTGTNFSNSFGFNSDIFSLTFDFTNPTFGSLASLTSGNYWLAVREGIWGSAYDGTSIRWQTIDDNVLPHNRVSSTNTGLNPSLTASNGRANSFVLFDSSGPPAVPEPSSFAGLLSLAVVGLLASKRQRRRQAEQPVMCASK